jgi:hypothetical protein
LGKFFGTLLDKSVGILEFFKASPVFFFHDR